MLTLYPSLHLKDGTVARLTRTSKDIRQAELLHPDPIECAAQFETDGFPWLHIVDLDAAFSRSSTNAACIEAITKRAKIPVQLSGGIHNMHDMEKWFEKGVACIVLTSAAQTSPAIVFEAAKRFPGKIAVKIDSLGGYVANTGWTEISSLRALDLALRVEEAGVAKIIYADINVDSALSEIDIESTIDLAFALTIPVIASGGVNSLHDLAELNSHTDSGISGLILGRALYNGTIRAKKALEVANT